MFKDFFFPQGIDEEGDFMPFLSMRKIFLIHCLS